MSAVHGHRSSDDHVSRDTTASVRVSTAGGSTSSGRPAPLSALSATATPFVMVPSSVRLRGVKQHPTAAASASNTEERKEKPRARRTRKPKDKGGDRSSGHDDELEDKPPANGHTKPKTKAKKKKQETKQTAKQEVNAAVEDEDEDAECCLLCADPIGFFAIGECNHLGICSKCSLRMRVIMKDRSCPMCKAPLERVIVSAEARAFESFQLWGDAAGWDSVLDEPSDMIFFECKPHYEALCRLREFGCRVKKCREAFHSLGPLKEHMRHAHGVEFCELCLQHQSFFIQEQQVFTKSSLKAHNVGRNRAVGHKLGENKDFHPVCQFCRKRFYGDLELFNHLERDHFKCHICKVEHEYYRNYASLETHFRREHHLCEDPKCLGMRFVVFKNNIDYQGHMSSVHGVQNRLLFNFQVARGGENPVGGQPAPSYADEGPDFWNFGEVPAPAPADPQSQLDAAFPALPNPGGPAPPPLAAPAIARSISPARQPPVAAASAPVAPRGQIVRNQRLAQALGLARPSGSDAAAFEDEMKTPKFPPHLIEWAKANTGYLLVVERRLERIVMEASCHSVSLRPMPSEERALMHELASYYGVASESFGEDPRRRISFYKKEGMRVPGALLSAVTSSAYLRPAPTAAARLKFLPLRGAPPPADAAGPRPAAPPVPVNRGWEKIEPKKRPVVKDAWSDDEDGEETAVATAVATAGPAEDEDGEA